MTNRLIKGVTPCFYSMLTEVNCKTEFHSPSLRFLQHSDPNFQLVWWGSWLETQKIQLLIIMDHTIRWTSFSCQQQDIFLGMSRTSSSALGWFKPSTCMQGSWSRVSCHRRAVFVGSQHFRLLVNFPLAVPENEGLVLGCSGAVRGTGQGSWIIHSALKHLSSAKWFDFFFIQIQYISQPSFIRWA